MRRRVARRGDRDARLLPHVPPRVAIDLFATAARSPESGALGAAMFVTLATRRWSPRAPRTLASFRAARLRRVNASRSTSRRSARYAIACAWAAFPWFSRATFTPMPRTENCCATGPIRSRINCLPQGVPIIRRRGSAVGQSAPGLRVRSDLRGDRRPFVSATRAGNGGGARRTARDVVGGLIVCGAAAYAAFPRRPRERAHARPLRSRCNPVAIWCAAEGHNDALALAIVLAGIALARRGHPQIGAFLFRRCAGAVKLPAVVAGAFPAGSRRRGWLGSRLPAWRQL